MKTNKIMLCVCKCVLVFVLTVIFLPFLPFVFAYFVWEDFCWEYSE